jgi:hypothetical protein
MDPDQTARMRRLVWIHAGRKTHYVGFVVTRLKFALYLGGIFFVIICLRWALVTTLYTALYWLPDSLTLRPLQVNKLLCFLTKYAIR